MTPDELKRIREYAAKLGAADGNVFTLSTGETNDLVTLIRKHLSEEYDKAAAITTAWNELYKCFGERMQQDELDLMDTVLQGVTLDVQDRTL